MAFLHPLRRSSVVFALASSLFLPFGASAVPINAADGVADTVPTATSGARRPSLLPKPAAD